MSNQIFKALIVLAGILSLSLNAKTTQLSDIHEKKEYESTVQSFLNNYMENSNKDVHNKKKMKITVRSSE